MTFRDRTRQDPDEPLGAHVALLATFGAVWTAIASLGSRQGRLPKRISWRDVVLLSLGAYKISRLVATDRVTLVLRAPFLDPETREPTGTGLRRALGELLTCPFCVAPWATLGLGGGLVWAPRATRYACGLLGAMVLADLGQRGYGWLQSTQKAASYQAASARAQLLDRDRPRPEQNGPG